MRQAEFEVEFEAEKRKEINLELITTESIESKKVEIGLLEDMKEAL